VHSPNAENNLVWFSNKERKYKVHSVGLRFFGWKQDEEAITWDWDNCLIDVAKQLEITTMIEFPI
jgi:hypothetical protein